MISFFSACSIFIFLSRTCAFCSQYMRLLIYLMHFLILDGLDRKGEKDFMEFI